VAARKRRRAAVEVAEARSDEFVTIAIPVKHIIL
jgi:hypothetical protein